MAMKTKRRRNTSYSHEAWLALTKKNDASDFSFSITRGRGNHNKENRARGHGRRHE